MQQFANANVPIEFDVPGQRRELIRMRLVKPTVVISAAHSALCS